MSFRFILNVLVTTSRKMPGILDIAKVDRMLLFLLAIKKAVRMLGWLSRLSVWLLMSTQVMISWRWDGAGVPHTPSLHSGCGACLSFPPPLFLPLILPVSLPHFCAPSLKKKQQQKTIIILHGQASLTWLYSIQIFRLLAKNVFLWKFFFIFGFRKQ